MINLAEMWRQWMLAVLNARDRPAAGEPWEDLS